MSGNSPLHPQYLKLLYHDTEINSRDHIMQGNKTSDNVHAIIISK